MFDKDPRKSSIYRFIDIIHRSSSRMAARHQNSALWRSLRHRDYKLYLSAQLVSVCGTWMQQVAQSWLIYRLTGSATLLGVVGFASQIPIFALGPICGVLLEDRNSTRLISSHLCVS